MNSKGNIFDGLVIITILFGVAIAMVIFVLIVSEINPEFKEMLDSQESADIIDETLEAVKLFDYTYVILVSMLITSSVISAFFIRSHPIFFFTSTILVFVFLIPAAVFSNAFEKFSLQTRVATVMGDMPLINYFMGKLPWILVISMVLIMIALFVFKNKEEAQFYQ